MAQIFIRISLQLGANAISAALRTALLYGVILPEILEHSRPCRLGNGTGADDNKRMQVDSLKKGKGKGQGKHPGRLVRFQLPKGRTILVFFHACDVQKLSLSLGCLPRQEYWTDLSLFFLGKIQTQHSLTQLHKETRLFFVIGMLMARLLTAGGSDDVSRVTDDWPTNVGRCGGTDASPSCNTQRSRHS